MTFAPPPTPPATPPPTPPSPEPPSWEQPPSPGSPVRPQLRRSGTDKMLGGVCGGLADYSGIDTLLWRVGFVGLTVAGGAGILVYLLLWVLMPPAPRNADEQPAPLDRLAEQLHHKVSASRWTSPRS